MKVLYLDESGDHSLDKIDPQYPVFVLGGVIIDRTYARNVVDRRLRELKNDFFGREDLILHTAGIIRAKNGFEALVDREMRGAFLQALNELMASLEYQTVACVIKKDEHLALHGSDARDPYMLGLEVLVERFCYEIGNRTDGGLICAENVAQNWTPRLNRPGHVSC